MKFQIKDSGKLLKITFQEWFRKDPFRESAVIAYYAIFGIPGLLVLIITFTGYFFGKDVVNDNILTQISSMMGVEIADTIRGMLLQIGHTNSNFISTMIGFGVLLAGATGVFVELQKSLNTIWGVKAVPKKGISHFIKARLFSFGLIVVIAFLLLVSLVLSTVLAAFSNWITNDTSHFISTLFSSLNFIFSFAVISVLFALMFKILPDAKIKWKHVWIGSMLTALLFTIGKMALAYYFGKVHPASAYGVAGSVILILLWVSYSSMILFFGAEFTATYAHMYSGEILPTEIARKDSNITNTK